MPFPTSIDHETLAKLQGLRLRARSVVEGYLAGLHRSPSRGFSIEFAEHREYVPGDDLRYVDWRVFGRSDKLYLKQYEDETNLLCYLLLDISRSMIYRGSASAFSKLEYAQLLAASLAWLVLHQQDAVALATFDSEIRTLVRPGGAPSHWEYVVDAMEASSPGDKTAAGPIFHELAQRLSRRGMVVVLSDCLDEIDSFVAGLKHFRHRRHDCLVLQILDPAELDFPFRAPAEFKGLEDFLGVQVDPQTVRLAYLREIASFNSQLASACRASGIDYALVRTDQPLDEGLTTILSPRRPLTR